MNKKIIELTENEINYNIQNNRKIYSNDLLYIIIINIIIFTISIIFCLLQNFEWKPLMNLNKFKRIKKNMNSWISIVNEKIGIEINKAKMLISTNPNVINFTCLDYGNYYVPGRLSQESFLPEFIRRGNSGPWVIKKADNKDISSLQFCKYLINKHSLNSDFLISCGLDMFEKLGFSGYFIENSPCEKAINMIINQSKNT